MYPALLLLSRHSLTEIFSEQLPYLIDKSKRSICEAVKRVKKLEEVQIRRGRRRYGRFKSR